MFYIKLFIIALLVFIASDAIWLGVVAKKMYIKEYAHWLRLENGQLRFLWWAAAAVYFLLALAVISLVLPLANGFPGAMIAYGALLGLIVYGVYDFTCLAIFKDFPVPIAFLDIAWGVFVCAFSSLVTGYLAKLL